MTTSRVRSASRIWFRMSAIGRAAFVPILPL